MDRNRGSIGLQSEERPHLGQQPFDRGRACFECGQLGHLARDCLQRISRGYGGRPTGLVGRAFVQGWGNQIIPGFRQSSTQGREHGYLSRDDGHRGWQQDTNYDRGETYNPGSRGREPESRHSTPVHNRVRDRDRERKSGGPDTGSQPQVQSACNRPSEQSAEGEYKKPRNSGFDVKPDTVKIKDVSNGDIAARISPKAALGSCDQERGREDGGRIKKEKIVVEAGGTAPLDLHPGDSKDSEQVERGSDPEERTGRLASASLDLNKDILRASKDESPSSCQGRDSRAANRKGANECRPHSARPGHGGAGREEVRASSHHGAGGDSVLRDDKSNHATTAGRRSSRWDSGREGCSVIKQSASDRDREARMSSQPAVRERISGRDSVIDRKMVLDGDVCGDYQTRAKGRVGMNEREGSWQNAGNGSSCWDKGPPRGNEPIWCNDQDKRSRQPSETASPSTSGWGKGRLGGRDKEGTTDWCPRYGSREDNMDRGSNHAAVKESDRDGVGVERGNTRWSTLEKNGMRRSYPIRNGYGSRCGDNNCWREAGDRDHASRVHSTERRSQSHQNWEDQQQVGSPCHDSNGNQCRPCNDPAPNVGAVKPHEVEGPVSMAVSPVPPSRPHSAIEWHPLTPSGTQCPQAWTGGPQPPDQKSQGEIEVQKSNGWCYIDRMGVLQGPLDLVELKGRQLQSDHMVWLERSNEVVTLEHAKSPHHCSPRVPSPGLSTVSSQGQPHPEPQSIASGYGDLSCQVAAGTDLNVSAIWKDFHIDERVDNLMRNFPLVAGREQETVSEALKSASRRVSEELEFESEDSPRSHGGFANVSEQWKDGDYGIGPAGFAFDSQISSGVGLNAEVKAEVSEKISLELTAEVVLPMGPSPAGAHVFNTHVKNLHCWKYPSAGGDWRLVPAERCELFGPSSEKLVMRKEVLNSNVVQVGRSGLPDPRRHADECQMEDGEPLKLDLPRWALRLLEKVENIADDHHAHYSHPSATTPKGHVSTPKSHLSTPVSYLSTPKGAVLTPKVSKGSAVGNKPFTGVKGPGNATSLAKSVAPPRQPIPTAGIRQKPGGASKRGETQSASKQDPAVVPSKPGGVLGNDVKGRCGGDHSDRTGIQNHSLLLSSSTTAPSFSPNASLENIASFDTSFHRASGTVDCVEGKKAAVVLRRHELRLEEGFWHYLGAAGHEMGPFSMSSLRSIVAEGGLPDGASVYRKTDDIWVPVSSLHHFPSQDACFLRHRFGATLCAALPMGYHCQGEVETLAGQNCFSQGGFNGSRGNQMPYSSLVTEESRYSPSEPLPPAVSPPRIAPSANVDQRTCVPGASSQGCIASWIFHDEHPQFLGYTNGKLHEHVMKSFKGIFAGFLNDALVMWLSEKQSGLLTASVPPVAAPAALTTSPATITSAAATSVSPPAASHSLAAKAPEGRSIGIGSTGNDRKLFDHQSKLLDNSTKVRHGKPREMSSLDQQAKAKSNTPLNHQSKLKEGSPKKPLPRRKMVSSSNQKSTLVVASSEHQTSQQSGKTSPHMDSVFGTGSSPQPESSKASEGKACTSIPVVTDTATTQDEPSPSKTKRAWIVDEEEDRVQKIQLHRRPAPRLHLVESDESEGDGPSQGAFGLHLDWPTSMAPPTEVYSETTTVDKEILAKDTDGETQTELSGGLTGKDRERQQGWAGLLRPVLKNVFCLLHGDPKSLVAAMATCKSWKEAVQESKKILKTVDLSELGSDCTNAVPESLGGYSYERHTALRDCPKVSPEARVDLLKAHPSIPVVDVEGCNQLRDMVGVYSQVKWANESATVCASSQGQDSHRKLKSLNLISKGERLNRGLDGYSGYSLDESGSRDKSTEEEYSTGAEPMIIDSGYSIEKDMETNQVHDVNGGFKRVKVSSGKKVVQSGLANGFSKGTTRQHLTNGRDVFNRKDFHPMKRKVKAVHRLTPQKLSSAHRSSSDRSTSPNSKVEIVGKGVLISSKDEDKGLEKELAGALKTVMEADIDKVFFHMVNGQVSDGKGFSSKSGHMDFLTVEKKLKMGAYGGKDGVQAFKDDILKPVRSAFRLDQGSRLYQAAKMIFKVADRVGRQLDNYLLGARSPASELAQLQNKALCNGGLLTRTLGKVKSRKISTMEKRSGTKRAWDPATLDGRPPKGKISGLSKKRRLGDLASVVWEAEGDFSDRDRDREKNREVRRLLRIKKDRWSESEAESSDEDDDLDETMFEDPEEEETEASGSEVATESEGEDGVMEDDNEDTESDEGRPCPEAEGSTRDWWGARMTKAAMVPPVTRKYEVIEEYRIVDDVERVERKMKVELPDDYEEKLQAAKEKRGDQYAHLDVPDLKDFRPRKRLGEEVLEQEVYGIDPYTYNLLLNTMPADTPDFSDKQKQQFIEERLLRALNRKVCEFTGSGRAPMEYSLAPVVSYVLRDASDNGDQVLQSFCTGLLKNMQSRPTDKYVAYRKGLGVVCNKPDGFDDGDFVVEFFGEVYPPWKWYEKQDGVRALQKKEKDPAPEFYNIVFERPKGDASGYDVLVVDAMHKANFASRLCHSCRPNCEAKVTAVNGSYLIGVYTLRKIEFGEELTFDYCCVTESKEEHDSSVCLCGSQGCKGSYLCYTGPGAYDEVLKESHGLLDRQNLLLQACTSGHTTQKEWEDLKQAGLGSCLLQDLPNWVIKYAAGIVAYLSWERQRLPDELMKAEKLKKTGIELSREEFEVQTEGVYNQRLQNLAITVDKVRYILTKLYGQATMAPPPLRMLEPCELVDFIWTGENSLVAELLQCMASHLSKETLFDLRKQIQEHDPPVEGDAEKNLQQSLLWLRDELRKVPATCRGRHDAAADLIHLYAYTKHFFTNHEYGLVESSPILIHALDLGPKHSGPGPHMWRKIYSKNYVWGQLITWFRQNSADPGASLVHERRGCLMLPDISSCYARSVQHDFRRGYSDKDRKKMIYHMETQPQKKWTPKYTPGVLVFQK